MKKEAGRFLKVRPLRGGVRGDEDADGIIRIVECALDLLAFSVGHAAVQDKDALGRVLQECGAKPALEIGQGGLVFGEDDEPLRTGSNGREPDLDHDAEFSRGV